MLWTAEAIEELKRLALKGKSASAIAAAIGAASRNAVIGKANRIGIKLNGGGRAAPSGGAPAAARGAQSAAFFHPQPAPSKWKAAWTGAAAEVAETQGIRFEEIREFACRWPLGDPKSGDLVYCGVERAEGHSYCAAHCRMAYRPPKAASPRGRQYSRSLANWPRPGARL